MENQKKRILGKLLLIWVFIIIFIVVGVFFYLSNRNSHYLQNGHDNNTDHKTIQANLTPTQTIVITGTNYSFSPNTITVKKGTLVVIHFKIVAGTHNFNIDAFNVHTIPLGARSQITVQFSADKTGSYPIYSAVGNDKTMGMTGKLVIQ